MKKKTLCIIMIMMLFVFSSCSDNNTISFGTGNIGGNYYSYGNAYSQLLKTDNDSYSVNVRTTAGSAANLRLIQQGFLDAAIAQSDTLLEAYNGNGSFEKLACTGVRAIAGLYTEECQIIVPADSEILTINDLYGKKVSVGEKESGVTRNAEHILLVNGLSFDMIDEQFLSFSDSADALENGRIDAFFCTAGAPTTAVNELSKSMPVRIISLDENTINKIVSNYPGYIRCTIPASTYAGQDYEVNTVGVKAVLIAGSKVSDQTAYQLVKTLFDHRSEIRYSTNADELNEEFAVSGIPVPFHRGAALWYSENGITVSSESDGRTGAVPNAAQD